jgi:FkbM family methyltransferase
MYHGQFDPPVDALIELFFPRTHIGSCVEVGAVDGVYFSNTLHFEQLGWKALCIEPNTYYHAALQRNRNLMLPYAISNENRNQAVLHRVKIGDTYDAATALQLDPTLMQQLRPGITEMDDIFVDVRTLDFSLQQVGWTSVDFVSIDTEGTELNVLMGFNLNYWKPKLLVIEDNCSTPQIVQYLMPLGYGKVLRYRVNDFYLRLQP